MRPPLAAILICLAGVVSLAQDPVCASSKEIKVAFSKFVAAQNAHDLKAVGELLSDSPDFLWITPRDVVRDRDAALGRYAELFKGTWRVSPDWSTFEIVMLDVSTAEIFVRVAIANGGQAQPTRLNQVLVNTPRGWRVLSILTGSLPTR